MPSVALIRLAVTHTARLTRTEIMMRLRMSRPSSSVPRTWRAVPPNSIGGVLRERRSIVAKP